VKVDTDHNVFMNTQSNPAIQSTPALVRSAWMSAVTSGDAEALRPLITDDYELWPHARPPLRGIDATVAAMRAAMQQFRIEQHFETEETVIAGDWAFERGVETMTVTALAGGPSRTMTQRALLILRRGTDQRWRYARGMTNGLPESIA
jgi:ketosteroid isomerase-like protein